ncbi:MAG: DNA topoisomerase IV subunit A [Alphaproteobacteria bacterium]|nr:DNA topoisomerase IV subunit A [Alphaproteobacteria bacterium]OJV14107.1 MAG: DNA topoisomerase IV subunit A [Alphaproteobacteria bacterium 33-17]
MEKNKIITQDFNDVLGERYLSYALSTIMSRSLPDVRDGLKPVHRRLLYAMLELKLDPKSGYKKCARVVGDVIGKFHPHGDQSVYDALVRLAQSFSLRYPLIEGQGNFGSIDGDNAAAMRYTESRLTDIAMHLMQDISENTVEFRPTYDSSEDEPVVMPANFPNLLANGSEGIAVGMATSVPPHNLEEICNAILALIENPKISDSEIASYIKGPDFPTGGIVIDTAENIRSIYETGRGSLRVRARWHKQTLAHGLYQIVITEIPYQVQKSKLIEKLADLLRDKKLVLINNIRDESAEDIRIVIEPKNRSVEAETIMESLFKSTDLEVRFNYNMNVLDANLVPGLMGVKGLVGSFLLHRVEVVTKRSQFRLDKINNRLHILDALMIAYLNIDEVIRIIREEDEPKAIMMKKWHLSDIQCEAILNMRLRSLRKLEEVEIKKEQDSLSKDKAILEKILGSEKELLKVIKKEITELKTKFGESSAIGKRRTDIIYGEISHTEIDINAFIEKEPLTVIISKMGWIRSVKGFDADSSEFKFKDGDDLLFHFNAYTTDKIIMASNKGRFFTILADRVPKGKGFGEPIRVYIDLEADNQIMYAQALDPMAKLLLVADNAKGFIVPEESLVAQTKTGKQVFDTGANNLIKIINITHDSIAVIGQNRKMLVFPIEQIPAMKKGQGVSLQKYKDGTISDIINFNLADGLSWKFKSRNYHEKDLLPWQGNRAGSGRIAPTGFPMDNKFTM